MYINENEARIHNLILRLYKSCESEKLKKGLDKAKLSNEIYFRESDFKIAIDGGVLVEDNERYVATEELIEQIEILKTKRRNDSDISERKKEFQEKFKILDSSDSYTPTKELIELASNIHWNILPEYEEYMIVNSELYPNVDTEEYYNHFHALEDLYKELISQGKKVNSKKGDVNLNKAITINIYSRRWGHTDPYNIERTVNGWKVRFHQEREGSKEGDALIKTLRHDLINYPASLGTFMWHLWNKADASEMSIDELRVDLEQIANWINVCEENTPKDIEV